MIIIAKIFALKLNSTLVKIKEFVGTGKMSSYLERKSVRTLLMLLLTRILSCGFKMLTTKSRDYKVSFKNSVVNL